MIQTPRRIFGLNVQQVKHVKYLQRLRVYYTKTNSWLWLLLFFTIYLMDKLRDIPHHFFEYIIESFLVPMMFPFSSREPTGA
jgi:hypothetical protein